MKLGTLKDGGRDGTLIVANRGLTHAVRATEIVPTLQKAMEDWAAAAPRLAELSGKLEADKAPGAFELDTTALAAPLPRAYQWADGSAYVVHVELVRKARGVEMPPSFWTDPLMYQGGRTRPGASISRARSESSWTMCRWASRPRRHGGTSSW